jgi:HAD superfamily hydrolase (TIGR01509 family)
MNRRREGALLLDLDGVLFDSEPLHRTAWETCLSDLGVRLEEGWYGAHRGHSMEVVAEALARAVPGLPAAELVARKRGVYRALARGVPPYPEVAEALAEQRIRAAVVSSSPREEVELLLRGSPLERLLEVIVTRDDVTAPKPEPDGYLLAMLRLGLSPERCVAVEDSETGIRAACAAALRVVVVAGADKPPPSATAWRATSAEAIRLASETLGP